MPKLKYKCCINSKALFLPELQNDLSQRGFRKSTLVFKSITAKNPAAGRGLLNKAPAASYLRSSSNL